MARKKLNVCFDGRVLKNGLVSDVGRTGIYFVTKNLFLKLYENSALNLYLYLDKEDLLYLNKLNEDMHITIRKEQILYADSDFSEINAFLSTIYKAPEVIKQYPSVSCYIILHDVIPLLFPKYFDALNKQAWFKKLIDSLNENDYYFTNSDYTKADFLKFCTQLDADKMKTIPLGTNQKYKPNKNKKQLEQVKKKYNIPTDKKYLFSLCSLEPRKNLIRAVRSFIEFIKRNKIDDLVYILGGSAWQGFIEKFEQEVPDYKQYADKIIRAGYVADGDLDVLYSNAEWFVYTSQYEGFGMPPLEAMACGCPVITSNNSSLPEVVGDAGIMIDFDSDEQHIKAYEKYYFDDGYRQQMARKGLERSKLFSWTAAANIIVKQMQAVEAKKAKQPLVTIITAAYNLLQNGRETTFRQCVKSVHNQTYPNIEHIVIDGASKDGTLNLLQEYQDKGWIKYYSEPDKGIYDAMNKGILKAKGKYVVCLNSDDFYCNNKAVELLVKKAEETDADACCGGSKIIDEDGKIINLLWKAELTNYIIFGQMACHQTFLIKTDVMKELGLYDLKYKISSDTAFMYKMLQNAKKIVIVRSVLINYRLGGASSDAKLVKCDVINSMYCEYGQYHHLSYYDCQNLFAYSYVHLPLDEAIKLGNKLEVATWREAYFKHLFSHYAQKTQTDFGPLNSLQQRKICYKLFGFLPLLKIKRKKNKTKIFLFKLPILTHKYQPHKNVWKFFGVSILKIRTNATNNKRKYYVCGIPVLKIKLKVR